MGSTRITFQFFSDTNCSTPLTGGGLKIGYPILDTWLHLVSDEVSASAGAMSAGVYLFTWQNFANEPVRAHLDDIVFADTTLFWDDFESGGVGAWSSSVP
jgi:hypothetical protein